MFPSVSGVGWPLWSLVVFAGLVVVLPAPTGFADPPDDWLSPRSAEFAGVIDRVPLGFRDTAAFVALLKQVRSSPSADLIKEARRGLSFQELFTQPSLHRGELVEVRGVAQRVYSSKSNIGAKGELFEVWITIPEKSPNPFACVVEELPPGFPSKSVVSAPVVFRGFFLKVISYQVEEVRRAHPYWLVGWSSLHDRSSSNRRAGQDNRLPSGADQRRVVPAIEDQFKVELGEDDRLTVEGHPIARWGLAEEVKLLAEQTSLNARLLGLRTDSKNGLPALVSFRRHRRRHARRCSNCWTFGRLAVSADSTSN